MSNENIDAGDCFVPVENLDSNENFDPREATKLGQSRPLEFFLDTLNDANALAWYRETGNPLFAWDVLAAYLQRNELPPPDVVTYLQKVCRAVACASGTGASPDERRQLINEAVVPVVGNRGSHFEEYRTLRRNWAIVAAVDDLKMRFKYALREQTMLGIFDTVAQKSRISAEAVKKIYERRDPKGDVFSIEHEAAPGERKLVAE